MRRRTKVLVTGIAVALALGVGAGIAVAGDPDDDDDRPITGRALERASAAALAHTGGGEVTDTEIGDEESYYEVEVTLDGGQVDVQLDRDFRVVGDEADDDTAEDGGSDG